jgi:hypothetical protein
VSLAIEHSFIWCGMRNHLLSLAFRENKQKLRKTDLKFAFIGIF